MACFLEQFDALICPVAPQAAFPHNLSLPSVERELVVEGRHYPYWDHVIWSGALANFAYLPATARPITFTSAGLPIGNPDRRPVSGGPNTDPRSRADGRSIRRLRTTSRDLRKTHTAIELNNLIYEACRRFDETSARETRRIVDLHVRY